MKKIQLTLVLITAVSLACAQSPWVKEKGQGYAQISFNTINEYNSLFLASGESYNLPRSVTDRSIQFYGEFGIGRDWQISAALPYKLLETGEVSTGTPTVSLSNDAGKLNSLGNVELAAKRNFINDEFLLSGQLKVELPTGRFDQSTGLRSGLDATSIIPSVSIGKGWNEMYGFVSVGSSIRTNEYSGDIRIGGELGASPIDKLWLVLVLDVVSSFKNSSPEIPDEQQQTGLYLNNQEYFAYGLKGAYKVTDDFGLNLAFYGASSGNFVAKSPSLNIGLFYEW